MRVGCISYVNHSGLGVIAENFRKNLKLDSQFIIRHQIKGSPGETCSIGIPHTFGDQTPTREQLYKYIDICKPEAMIVVETPFNFDFFEIMYDKGIGVVLIPMIDSIGVDKFVAYKKYITCVINFTKVGHEIYLKKWKGNKVHIPYPVDIDYFNPSKIATEKTFDFLHSAGWGGAQYRKGTDTVFQAFRHLSYSRKNPSPSLRVHGQPGEVTHSLLDQGRDVATIVEEDVVESIGLYRNGKVYLAPGRREGLGLSVLEAMACGLPVITTDAPPMNEWFPKDYPLLVKVHSQQDLPYGDIFMYNPSALNLMEKMEFTLNNPKLMTELGKKNSIIIQRKYSWDKLKESFLKVLEKV